MPLRCKSTDAAVAYLADLVSDARLAPAQAAMENAHAHVHAEDDDYAFGGRDPAAALRKLLALDPAR
jgi:hypothetical protein